ncbi:GntR family transcriptional regulator [Paenibacillus dendritiformis]|uniref:GntR family transcriptional regulator n=1 Tax=Paenibacillus dendritiformis TaxID=130049 RepID=UPI001059D9CF|nr:GntR family transcriptional regulator [Paenibacillus dendritiformis]TDL52902.1 GntR family transcriptional regulator [Paenibacillus dendritiformis]
MFRLQEQSASPIYEQIVDQMKALIATGALEAGEKVPSVRELSAMLLVNPNTVSKAYQELERQGVIVTMRGKGTFVAEAASPGMAEERMKKLREDIKRIALEAKHLGLEPSSLLDMVEQACHEWWREES